MKNVTQLNMHELLYKAISGLRNAHHKTKSYAISLKSNLSLHYQVSYSVKKMNRVERKYRLNFRDTTMESIIIKLNYYKFTIIVTGGKRNLHF